MRPPEHFRSAFGISVSLFIAVLMLGHFRFASGSINAACKCLLFNSTFDKEFGVFHSPNWPQIYEDNINCLLYTFQSRPDQIIEVTFDEFDVQKANLE
jgi:hypothetical protein